MKKPKARSRAGPRSQQADPVSGRAPGPPVSAAGMFADQAQPIQALIDLLKQNNLAELEVERAGIRIRLRRESAVPSAPAVRADSVVHAQESPAENLDIAVSGDMAGKVTITSPIVGTFYRSPSPDADPYVEEGDQVKKGQVLCIVEAMKLMNEIESEIDGRIVKILAESTKPVEYGQPLFLVDPTSAP
ncbi:MAG: acetyl-CoA carboxylase biotin carboxyl carrier protein [Nitrospiraceae bacterium]